MKKFNFYCSLASGSKGNCSIISYNGTNILIDIGISYRALTKALDALGLMPSDIDALLITHEHSDHIKGLSTFLKKNITKVYASFGTASELYQKFDDTRGKITEFHAEDNINIDDFLVTPYSTPHDGTQSMAFLIKSATYKIGFMTDLGFVPDSISKAFKGCNLAILESNYDEQMLKNGPYPYQLKQRILGTMGHLSNEQCGLFASYLANHGTEIIVLAHLSENNNTPHKAVTAVEHFLDLAGANFVYGKNLHVAPVKESFNVIELVEENVKYA